jgi:plastocyanin
MRKGMWWAAAVVTLVVGGIVVLGAPTLRAADTRVALGSDNQPLKFLPAEITVPVGSTVEWYNETDLQHDVSADDGSFDSKGLLGRGQKFEFKFSQPGDFKYFCTPHKDAGMKGVVHVTGAGTPTTVAATPTTQPAAGATTTTTAAKAGAAAASTSTTAKSGAASTTTSAAGNGATTTTLAPSVTPTSAPDTAGETTTTTAAAQGGGEEAAADHGGKKEKTKNSPIGIAFASVSTLLLAAIAGKLLASKS